MSHDPHDVRAIHESPQHAIPRRSRRSIRLQGYDYSQAGAYFVTICTQNRECLFGEIVNGEMRLNDAGKMIQAVWDEIPAHYPGIDIDAFVVMPNHIHAIVVIVGAAPRGRPDSAYFAERAGTGANRAGTGACPYGNPGTDCRIWRGGMDGMNNSEILIYQAADGKIKIDVRLEDETVWLTQDHMAGLFGKSKKTISEHIRNIFSEGELDEQVVVRNFRTTTRHGAMPDKTQSGDVQFYNLDVIISVGYRVKSHQGTQFRIWATPRLKEATRDAVRPTIQDFLWSEATGLPETYSEADVQDKSEAVIVHVFRAYPTVPSPYYADAACL